MGSRRRSAFRASRRRVSSFSLASSSLRAASHSSPDTTFGSAIAPPRPLGLRLQPIGHREREEEPAMSVTLINILRWPPVTRPNSSRPGRRPAARVSGSPPRPASSLRAGEDLQEEQENVQYVQEDRRRQQRGHGLVGIGAQSLEVEHDEPGKNDQPER